MVRIHSEDFAVMVVAKVGVINLVFHDEVRGDRDVFPMTEATAKAIAEQIQTQLTSSKLHVASATDIPKGPLT